MDDRPVVVPVPAQVGMVGMVGMVVGVVWDRGRIRLAKALPGVICAIVEKPRLRSIDTQEIRDMRGAIVKRQARQARQAWPLQGGTQRRHRADRRDDTTTMSRPWRRHWRAPAPGPGIRSQHRLSPFAPSSQPSAGRDSNRRSLVSSPSKSQTTNGDRILRIYRQRLLRHQHDRTTRFRGHYHPLGALLLPAFIRTSRPRS